MFAPIPSDLCMRGQPCLAPRGLPWAQLAWGAPPVKSNIAGWNALGRCQLCVTWFLGSDLALTSFQGGFQCCVNRGDWALGLDARDAVWPSGVSRLLGKRQVMGTPLTLTTPARSGLPRATPALATPASQPGAGPGSGHSDFPKRHRKSFGVRGRFLGEMKTLYPVSSEDWGLLCLSFILFFGGNLWGGSLGWDTGCELPCARVCAGH